jgi:hypothetical protein
MSVSGLEPWQLAHATGLVVDHNAWPFKDEIPRGPAGTGVGVVGLGAGAVVVPGAGVVPGVGLGAVVVPGAGVVPGVGVVPGAGVVPGVDVVTNDVK